MYKNGGGLPSGVATSIVRIEIIIINNTATADDDDDHI
jgi:hypothetical protein